MRIRHRVPMVFSMSMLDLFCCALGCVTLLWLVNQREAMLRARDSAATRTTLTAARSDLDRLRTDINTVNDDKDKLARAMARLQGDLDAARTRLANAKKQADIDATVNDTLTKTLKDANQRVNELNGQLKEAKAALAKAGTTSSQMSDKMKEYETLIAKLKAAAELVPDLKASAADKASMLTKATQRAKSLEEELESLRKTLAGLNLDKQNLTGQLTKAQAAADNRFEGIALSGKRVIFLVDMSGSMDLTDPNTQAPDKWPTVRDTLVKLFKSLPELEQYQVMLFSEQVSYPLGNEGKWLDRDAQSADRIHAALSTAKPKGNTDMYQAMDAVFRYRPAGLDTVYLLSDGLPNIGAGLAPETARTMTDTAKSDVLSRHVRTTLRNSWNAPQPGKPRVKINAVGFFYESPDVGAFLWALARENDGSFVGMSKP